MSSLLPYLELSSVKDLSFFESENSASYDLLVQRFPSLDFLFYSWCCRQNNAWMLFDVKKMAIKQVWTEVGAGSEVSIDFDVKHFNPKARHSKDSHLPSEQLQYIQDSFNHDEGERNSEIVLPPIKSLYMGGHAYDEKLAEFLEEKSDVPHIVLNIKHSDEVFDFPQIKFSSHCLVIKYTEGLASLLWASKWFPNLTALYLNGPIDETDLKDHEIQFESLRCFYTCHVQPSSFWKRLLESSRGLKQVFLSTDDPSFDQLREDYPNLSFGYWSKENQRMKEYVSFFSPNKYFFYSIDL
ncbi:hypothetical protein DSO57_1008558 [Entomophthora muscae]|uniref:Uncharacterized protein n=1 Tax=Entomophthora muscae TaxID=34485 RepID=A0ACC2USY3_9FUNG|nr:hypothetical protein DSO57_1008558 [Entomophthora muscae]